MSGWHKIILFGLLGLAQVTHAAMPWVSDQDAGYRSLSNLNIVTGDRAIFTNAIVHGSLTAGVFVGVGTNITGVVKDSQTNVFALKPSSNYFNGTQVIYPSGGRLAELLLWDNQGFNGTRDIVVSFRGWDPFEIFTWSIGNHDGSHDFSIRQGSYDGTGYNRDLLVADVAGGLSSAYADYVGSNSILRAYAMDERYLTNAGIPAITNLFVPWLRTNDFLHGPDTNGFVPWPATNAFLVGTATNALLLTNGNGSALSGITTGQIGGLAAFVANNPGYRYFSLPVEVNTDHTYDEVARFYHSYSNSADDLEKTNWFARFINIDGDFRILCHTSVVVQFEWLKINYTNGGILAAGASYYNGASLLNAAAMDARYAGVGITNNGITSTETNVGVGITNVLFYTNGILVGKAAL